MLHFVAYCFLFYTSSLPILSSCFVASSHSTTSWNQVPQDKVTKSVMHIVGSIRRAIQVLLHFQCEIWWCSVQSVHIFADYSAKMYSNDVKYYIGTEAIRRVKELLTVKLLNKHLSSYHCKKRLKKICFPCGFLWYNCTFVQVPETNFCNVSWKKIETKIWADRLMSAIFRIDIEDWFRHHLLADIIKNNKCQPLANPLDDDAHQECNSVLKWCNSLSTYI